MLLSRFWYVVVALAVGGAVFILFVAAQLYNRSGQRAMAEALTADSSAVGWYLKDDIRNRSSALIKISLNGDIRASLAKATGEAKPSRENKDKALSALKKLDADLAPDLKFSSLWAVDGNGRVIAAIEVDQTTDWELGGYPVVADALHGWIRDDAWVWKGRIYRVVARPVEQEVNGEPVGAIVGAKIVDDTFANTVSKKTGAAVGFYADGARVASWAPEGFDKANLDQITQDLKSLDANKDYQEKGRTEVRVLGEHLGVVYARLPGEAWDLGAGYAVGRLAVSVASPFDFLNKADDGDKKAVPTIFVLLAVVAAAGVGLFFTFLEYTQPLATFRAEALRMAKGEIDVLAPSRFRGAYKKIAADLNDGIEKVATKGGAPRRAADLEQVLGPIPAQPAMSAFSVPGPGGPDDSAQPSRPSFPKPPSAPGGAQRLRALPSAPTSAGAPTSSPNLPSIPDAESPAMPSAKPRLPPPPPRPKGPPSPNAPADDAGPVSIPPGEPMATSEVESNGAHSEDELADWHRVYEEFLAAKKQCGEATSSMSFDKFKGTLERNKAALVSRHNVARVKFTVYVKEGKAALKASPVK